MARPKSDPKQRFLLKVKQMETGCHEWTGCLHRDGYGKFYHEGKQVQAHRVAYEIFKGKPEKKWVLHQCDNRKCVNPDHLFLGSAIENIQDMDAKNRRGTKAKLTFNQSEGIKKLLSERYKQVEVAKIFGVHQTTISRIYRNISQTFKTERN
jgi:hypothetical protein